MFVIPVLVNTPLWLVFSQVAGDRGENQLHQASLCKPDSTTTTNKRWQMGGVRKMEMTD